MKKTAESENVESQGKSDQVENYKAPENVDVEEVNAEEITSPDVLSGTEIITEELKMPVQQTEEITPTGEATEESSPEENTVSQNVEESQSGETEKPAEVINSTEENLTHAEIKQEIKDEQEFLQKIQDQVANAEDDEIIEVENLGALQDYSAFTKEQLIEELRKVINEGSTEEIKPNVDTIKSCFYKIRNAEIQEKKKAFVAEGNEEILFVPEQDTLENDLKELLKEYKNQRAEINKKQDALKEENYQKKIAIIEEIKALVHSEESMNNTFQEFKELQEKWRKIGQVPQNKVKDLWESYHYNVELFYDFVKINRELRDLDLRRNMDLKVELCKKAEDLAVNNPDAQSSFKE